MIQSARLNKVPYHFGSPRRSRGSNVPTNATQQTPNGLARLLSKSAARTGAVVMVAWTPPGKRTGSAAATRVIAVQKPRRTKSISFGKGTDTRTRITPAAAMTGYISGRSGVGTFANHGNTGRRICEPTEPVSDTLIAKRRTPHWRSSYKRERLSVLQEARAR